MNPLDSLFCILYEFYENRKRYNRNVNPWFQVISMLALSFTFWVMLAGSFSVTRNLLPVHIKLIAVALIFIYFIFGYILYLVYVRNKRYPELYTRYKKQNSETPFIKKIISWVIILLPIAMFFIHIAIRAKMNHHI